MAAYLNPIPKDISPGRETIYLLRTIHENQTRLILLADQKANILISVVAVIITILSTNLDKIQRLSPLLLVLFLAFLVSELLTIGLGLLVILPKNIRPIPKVKRTSPIQTNLIFFGSFLQVPENEFVETMFTEIDDVNNVRRLFLRDIYKTGMVLQQKYTLLRYAYSAMIVGLCFLATLILAALFTGL